MLGKAITGASAIRRFLLGKKKETTQIYFRFFHFYCSCISRKTLAHKRSFKLLNWFKFLNLNLKARKVKPSNIIDLNLLHYTPIYTQ